MQLYLTICHRKRISYRLKSKMVISTTVFLLIVTVIITFSPVQRLVFIIT